jgi:hypothetical protein
MRYLLQIGQFCSEPVPQSVEDVCGSISGAYRPDHSLVLPLETGYSVYRRDDTGA